MCVSFESLCIYSNMMEYLYQNTQRNGMGREAGGGIGMGNTWLIHVNGWQKPLQYCKVISLQLIKINEKNKNKKQKNQKSYMIISSGYVCIYVHLYICIHIYMYVYICRYTYISYE